MAGFKINDDMREANGLEAMADAFHPSMLTGNNAHGNPLLDVIEAALLWGAGRCGRTDFLSALEDAEDDIAEAGW